MLGTTAKTEAQVIAALTRRTERSLAVSKLGESVPIELVDPGRPSGGGTHLDATETPGVDRKMIAGVY